MLKRYQLVYDENYIQSVMEEHHDGEWLRYDECPELTRLTAEVDSWRKMHSESYLAKVQADYKAERESGEKLAAEVARLRGALEIIATAQTNVVWNLENGSSAPTKESALRIAEHSRDVAKAALEEQA